MYYADVHVHAYNACNYASNYNYCAYSRHECFYCAQYIFIVMAVLILEAGVGALARIYEEQVGLELRANLNRTFMEAYSVRSRETKAIDKMQIQVSVILMLNVASSS